jgi:glycosyltransferase involved in cell wall biosynthesis
LQKTALPTKKALITRTTGWDGAYLAEFLVVKDYEVHGFKRRSSYRRVRFNIDRGKFARQGPFSMVKKVSIITICYNDCDGLKATLETIFAQTATEEDYEVIVVDGASTDCTLRVLEDMDSLIDRWVSEPDRGIYDAMNKGVRMAAGDYVIFMNSGDCFHGPEVLERAIALIDGGAPDLFYGRAYARESGKLYQYNKHLWQGMICSHQATFARRDLLRRLPFSTDFRIAADYNFYVQCDLVGASPVLCDIDVALIDTSGVSFSGFRERTEERMRICRTAYPRPEVYAHFKKLFARMNLSMPDWAQTEKEWLDGPA